jgi:hypothetical protein
MDGRDDAKALAASLFGLLVALVIYGAIGYGLYNYSGATLSLVIRGLSTLFDPEGRSYTKAIAYALLAVASAVLLYKLRTSARIQYSLAEIMFGVMNIFAASSPLQTESQRVQLLQLAAGIYIIVRGLDNLKTGLDEKPGHVLWPLWKMLLGPKTHNDTWSPAPRKRFFGFHRGRDGYRDDEDCIQEPLNRAAEE